jgi:hypothetical protein
MRLPSFAYPENLKVAEEEQEVIELAPGETSLHFFQRVYRSTRQPMARRMSAAREAIAHEHPRLSAVGVNYWAGDTFAARLERASQRSQKVIEGRAIEIRDEE